MGIRVFRIAIPSSRIDVSRVFYESVLGIDVDDTVPSRLYFHCGDVIVALIDWTLEAVAAGAQIVSPIEARGWGERSFYCLDPDGNRLCFVVYEPVARRPRGCRIDRYCGRGRRTQAPPPGCLEQSGMIPL